MSEKIKGLIEKIPSRYWIYLAVGVAAMLAIALPLALTETESVWYSLFWGAFGTAAAVIITRCIYHCATGDNSAEMWAISIYGVVADLGWLVGILTESYSVATIGIVILAAGMMMALGTRFVGKDGAKVKRAEVETLLAKTLRYRYMGDVIDGEVDIRRPLGKRVVRLLLGDVDLLSHPEHELSIVLNSYRATGTGGYGVYRKAEVLERYSQDVQDLLIGCFGKGKAVSVPPRTDFLLIR